MGNITVVGMGWTQDQLTLGAIEAFESGKTIILHTDHSGGVQWLRQKGIAFQSLDALYENCEDFDEHIEMAVEAVLQAAEEAEVVYGVLDVRDRSVWALNQQAMDRMRIIAGPSAEDVLLTYVNGGVLSLEASDWEDFHLNADVNCLIRELDNWELASEVKLKLMEVYPEDSEIWRMQGGQSPEKIYLYDLDRSSNFDHRTCVLVPAQRDLMKLERYGFEQLDQITRRLFGPGGCPWDRAQTHQSLRHYMLEETYEVIEAIDEGDMDHLYDELGDMLFQIYAHGEIARRHGEFDLMDVTTAISEKMIHRHGHVFGSVSGLSADQISEMWHRQKKDDRHQERQTEVLQAVNHGLPGLMRGVKVLSRSADVGMAKQDFTLEVQQAVERLGAIESASDFESALGDILFMLCNLARKKDTDPEIALNRSIDRFIVRFEQAERLLRENGDAWDRLDAQKIEKYWELVKL